MTIGLLFSLETCIFQIQSVWVNFACTKRLFNLSAEAIINVRNARLCARCAIFLLKNKQTPLSCRLVKEFTFLRRVQNQFRMLLEMCFVPVSVISTERILDNRSYVTTPRYIYACGKCGAWLFVHKVRFSLQQHVKTTKTDKTRFFFARKRWTWYPTDNYYLMSHFSQPNIERKNWVSATVYERLSEMCILQHVEMKSVFTFLPIKRLVSTTVKSAKPAATF